MKNIFINGLKILVVFFFFSIARAQDNIGLDDGNRMRVVAANDSLTVIKITSPDNPSKDSYKIALIQFVINQVQLDEADKEAIAMTLVELGRYEGVSNMQEKICDMLMQGNILLLDTSKISKAMDTYQEEIWVDMSLKYRALRSRMTPKGFSKLDGAIEETMSRNNYSNSSDILSSLPIVQAYLVKRKCLNNANSTPVPARSGPVDG